MKYKNPTDDQIIATIFVLIIVIVVGIISIFKSNNVKADIDKNKFIPKDTLIVMQDKPFYTNVQSTYKCNTRM